MSLHISYCKHSDHGGTSVVLAASDQTVCAVSHGAHLAADIGCIEKSAEDYHALLATHGAGLFAHLVTTWGSEMT